VRSSTSSSDTVRSDWLKIWLLATGLALATLAVWEVTLRQAGLGAEFSDNRALWLSARHKLTIPDPSVIAILGASRVQRGVDVNELSDQLQRPVVQLAVEGTSGLPVLENLAADPRFRGTVIVSIAPAFSFNRKLSKLDEGNQAEWVRTYVGQSSSRRMEQELRLFLQGKLTFRSADAAVTRTAESVLNEGVLPQADYKKTRRNRFVSIDQQKFERPVNQDAIVALYTQNSEPYEAKGFAELMQYFSAVVDVLNNKGCRVYIVRLPSEGKVLDFENRHFPQEQFWNEMKRNINASFVHFQDYPQLDGYLSVDGSHIDAAKATEFTAQLAEVLIENQL
jgi:hypothetical protein